jgi:plastocyanin
MKNTIIVAIVIVLIGSVVFLTSINSKQAISANNGPTVTDLSQPNASSQIIIPDSAVNRSINIEGGNFKFSPNEIRVKKGDTVKINFTNQEGMHDWVLDEFNVKTPIIKAGGSASVIFVADKAGTFEYYCSVGNHRAMGMKGNLIVE